MSTPIRGSLLGALALVCALALPACDSPARAGGEDPLRIGINVWPGYEPLYLAQETGIFRRAGVDVQIVEFTSSGDLMRAFAHGELDGFASTFVELLTLRAATEREAEAVLVLDYSNGGDVIVADPSVASVAELAGRRVALEPAAPGTLLLARALERAGLDFDDVTLVPADQLEMPRLAAEQSIAAAVIYPPVSLELVDAGYRILADSSQIPEEIVDVLSFDRSVLRQRPDAVRRVIVAWQRALDHASTHPQSATRIMAEREGLGPDEFRIGAAGVRLMTLDDQRHLVNGDGGLERTCRTTARALATAGMLDDGALAAGRCVDPGPLLAALGSSGV